MAIFPAIIAVIGGHVGLGAARSPFRSCRGYTQCLLINVAAEPVLVKKNGCCQLRAPETVMTRARRPLPAPVETLTKNLAAAGDEATYTLPGP